MQIAEVISYSCERKLKVTHAADVVVLGGGPGGIGAAVMAARAGASVVQTPGINGLVVNGESRMKNVEETRALNVSTTKLFL